ncbi:SAM-dependent methyltransferase [Herbidospora yilanensis]|uniref:SAM-dependent methyltransferase n=1 Tax=Herbidospora yilanensis TaxID=354426 RepID=UPI0007C64222|nr:methyltransferase domain-containing protein [Herbidospora yilanensis]
MSVEQLRRSARSFATGTRDSRQGPTADQVADFYDRNARALDEIYGGQIHVGYWTGPDDDASFREAAARLTSLMTTALRVGPGGHVLDLGCGPGATALQVARATGARVTGVAISRAEVELASALAEAESMTDLVAFRHADALDLPFEAGTFDAVLAAETIPHFPDRTAALRECARVLRPGGRLVLTDNIRRGPLELDPAEEEAFLKATAAWRMAPMARLEDYPGLVERAGFEVDEVADLTEHTKQSFRWLYVATREYAARHGDLPADLLGIFCVGDDVDWLEYEDDEEEHDGVVLVVARKPETDGDE